VLQGYAGRLPARAPGSANAAAREVIHDHGTAGGPQGLYSISGVKFTTARAVAAKTLKRIFPEHRPINEAKARPPALLDLSGERLTRAACRAGPADLVDVRLRSLVAEESVLTLDDLLLRRLDSTAIVVDLDAARSQATRLLGREIGIAAA
jgi:glycerol-3-phosphate dehydrogenase